MKGRFVTLATLGLVLFLAPGVRADDKENADDVKALRTRAEAFIAAFDKGDAEALANFWTPDGDYMDQTGNHLKGRKEIQKAYEKQFAVMKEAKLRIFPSSRRFIKEDCVIADGTTEVTPADGGPPLATRYTIVAVKQDGQWFLSSVRDSVAVAPTHAKHLDGMDWIVGQWVSASKDGQEVHVNFSWDGSGNFLVSDLKLTQKGVPVSGSTQWIGWDPAEKKIRSWAFLSQGGFTEGIWTKDGNKWTVEVKGVLHDGKKATATNVITIVDADNVTFQQKDLTVDGKAMPEREPVKLKRVKPT